MAKETGRNVPQVALNWLLQRPTVSSVIIGARNEEQLKQNLAAADFKLSEAQVAKLDKASDADGGLSLLAPAQVPGAEPDSGGAGAEVVWGQPDGEVGRTEGGTPFPPPFSGGGWL